MKPSFGKTYEPAPLPPDLASFFEAANSGDVETIRRLLATGVPVDSIGALDMPANQTPLMFAARHGHLEAVRVLLAAGANLAAIDEKGADQEGNHQPLHHAVMGEHTAVIEELLTQGANPDALTNYGNSPLNFAIRQDNFPIAQLLLARGASIRITAGRKRVNSPLCAAASAKLPLARLHEWVKFLLAAGADPNAPDKSGNYVLQLVTNGHDIENDDRLAVLETLLQAGANVSQLGRDGNTPIVTAVLYNNARAADLLAKAGGNVDAEIQRGTLLDVADQNLSFWQRESSKGTQNVQLREVWRRKLENATAMVEVLQRHGARRKAELN